MGLAYTGTTLAQTLNGDSLWEAWPWYKCENKSGGQWLISEATILYAARDMRVSFCHTCSYKTLQDQVCGSFWAVSSTTFLLAHLFVMLASLLHPEHTEYSPAFALIISSTWKILASICMVCSCNLAVHFRVP